MTLSGISDVLSGLDDLKVDGKRMRKDVNKILRHVLGQARNILKRDARSALPNDPRRAYMAVRHAVYKRVLGGNINILQKRKAGGRMSIYRPKRTLVPGQRGGNRRKRSARTNQIDGYVGTDRGFILRIVNAGAEGRKTRYGSRGSIKARPWFRPSSQKALDHAIGELENLIGRAVSEIWTS